MILLDQLNGGILHGELVAFVSSCKNKSTMMEPISRAERITLAVCVYGLYTMGLATTDSERCDEDCAMDNMRVPYYKEQLTPRDVAALERIHWCRDAY